MQLLMVDERDVTPTSTPTSSFSVARAMDLFRRFFAMIEARSSRNDDAELSHIADLRTRAIIVAFYALFLIALVTGSKMYGIGDAGEYYFMADKMAHFHRPQVSSEDLPRYSEKFQEIGGFLSLDLGIEKWHVATVVKRPGTDGPYFSVHSPMYSAFVAPFLAITDALHLNPVRGFTIANMTMLCGALWLVLRRTHPAIAVLIFFGPIFWWVDKMHSEVFAFSMIAVAMGLLRRQPILALPFIGFAASQNSPWTALLAIALCVVVLRDNSLLRNITFWISSAMSVALAFSTSVFNHLTLGVWNPLELNNGIRWKTPTLQEYLVVPFDLNLGIVVGAPIICMFWAVAAYYVLRYFRQTDWVLITGLVVATAWLLFSFTQTWNFNHGATPGMSRYCLWLLPLFLPFFQEAWRLRIRNRRSNQDNVPSAGVQKYTGVMRRFVTPAGPTVAFALVIISVLYSTLVFAPSNPEGSKTPSPIAAWVWEHQPQWDNPLVEVFFERNEGTEDPTYSTSDLSCSKLLIVNGQWPLTPTCPPQHPPIPSKCTTDALTGCLADRRGDRYSFRVIDPVRIQPIPVETARRK